MLKCQSVNQSIIYLSHIIGGIHDDIGGTKKLQEHSIMQNKLANKLTNVQVMPGFMNSV